MALQKEAAEFTKSLKRLVDKVAHDQSQAEEKAQVLRACTPGKRGRRSKGMAATRPMVLHLYTDQVRWLDQYAVLLEQLNPGNVHLRRVEIVRALLMGLAEYVAKHGVIFDGSFSIQCERDLQKALVRALENQR